MKLLSFALLLLGGSGAAQNDTTYVDMDEELRMVEDSTSFYLGKAFPKDGHWSFVVAGRKRGNVVLRSQYKDADLSILEGPYEVFFEDGHRKSTGSYLGGKQTGQWLIWDESRQLADSAGYEEGEAVWLAHYEYEPNGQIQSYEYRNTADNSVHSRSFKNGVLYSENRFVAKEGESKLFYPTGEPAYVGRFNSQGKPSGSRYYQPDGKELSEKEFNRIRDAEMDRLNREREAREPSFKGGQAEFTMWLQRNLRLPPTMIDGVHQTVDISFSFMLGEAGQATDVRMIAPNDVETERLIRSTLNSMPKWNMKGYKTFGPIVQHLRINH